MVKKILIVVAVVIAGFLGFVATRPATYHVERSATIQAPADVVFARMNSLKSFPEWSPWQKLDPNMKSELGGPESGVGATYHWVGNDDVGEGKMTITESKQNELVREDLEFIKPFASKAVITLSIAAAGADTKATWAMDGDNNFMAKMMGVFVSMDSMIGKDFDEGLANLKKIAEADLAKKKDDEQKAAEAAKAAAPVDGAPAPAAPAAPEKAPEKAKPAAEPTEKKPG